MNNFDRAEQEYITPPEADICSCGNEGIRRSNGKVLCDDCLDAYFDERREYYD